MKTIKEGDSVFYNNTKHFARVLEVNKDDNTYKITYTENIWTKPKGIVCIVGREDIKLFGDTTPSKRSTKAKAKSTKATKRSTKAKPRKAKAKPSNKDLDSILDLLD